MMDTAMAARAVAGSVIGDAVRFSRVTTDTRGLAPGDLFVALKGDRFDGHDFVAQALANGAAAAIVERSRVASLEGNLIAVDDPLQSLAALATYWRSRFAIPVAVVTGSNGKTTTKEMIAAIFRAAVGDDAVAATPGNFNNAIGLPLAVLALRLQHRLAVFELGMNHHGETSELARIAQPTIAVVTNAQREHQEFMRTVDEVAAEHADAIGALPENGAAVINADDPRVAIWYAAARGVSAQTVTFSMQGDADVRGKHAEVAAGSALEFSTPAGNGHVLIQVPGRHMAMNALAAVAVGHAAQVPVTAIVRGLQTFRPVRGRLVTEKTAAGVTVIDDSYNANPDSVRAAIDVLASHAPPRWLALGDMGEVGDEGPRYHEEIGTYARAAGIDRMFASGELMRHAVRTFGAGAAHFASVDDLGRELAAQAHAGVTLLVKGSRFMRMERIVAAVTGTSHGGAH